MSTIKIGPSGSEIEIPSVIVSLPIDYEKQSTRIVMSDGSRRWGIYQGFRRWTIHCKKLTQSQLDNLIIEYLRIQLLRFQNTYESATWYDVIMVSFSYDSADPISTTKYYTATIIVEET